MKFKAMYVLFLLSFSTFTIITFVPQPAFANWKCDPQILTSRSFDCQNQYPAGMDGLIPGHIPGLSDSEYNWFNYDPIPVSWVKKKMKFINCSESHSRYNLMNCF